MSETENQKLIKPILTVLLVVSILGMIWVSNYMTQAEITNYVTIQGDYPEGDYFGLYSGSENVSEMYSYTPSYSYDQPLGWDADNDTAFHGYKSGGIIETRDGIYYGNYNTYTGAGNHTMIVNWSHVPVATYDSLRYLFIPLNVTNSEIAAYDFSRVHSTIDKTGGAEFRIYYEESATVLRQINSIKIDSDTDLLPISYTDKQKMEAYPNGTVYLTIVGLGTNFVETQASFVWKMESSSIDPSDYLFGAEFTNTAIWFIVRMAMAFVLTIIVIFINPWFDTKLDMKKKRG